VESTPREEFPVPPLVAEDHVCSSCRIAYAEVPTAEALAEITLVPDRVTAAVDGVSTEQARTRRVVGGWSATEYACHLRDVYAVSMVRVHWACVFDGATVEPMFNNVRAARLRYNERDLRNVLDELEASVQGFVEEASLVADADWSRTVERLPGERRTVRWLLRQAMHEGVHHVADIRGVLMHLPPSA
jgi:uncharacterized damage-inducible protein DinB